MYFIHALIAALTSLFVPFSDVSAHHRNQAYGPRWSQHRRRRVDGYRRRQPRRR